MRFLKWAFIAFIILVFALLSWLSTPIRQAAKTHRAADHPSELVYPTRDGGTAPFGSIHDEPELFLSVVVPAYNEESRMQAGVDEMLAHLTAASQAVPEYTWEIILVDDGSKDNTYQLAVDTYVRGPHAPPTGQFRVLQSYANGGKGAAVRKGVLKARGQYILMADADGATLFSDIDRLMLALHGSSVPLEEESLASATVVGGDQHRTLQDQADGQASDSSSSGSIGDGSDGGDAEDPTGEHGYTLVRDNRGRAQHPKPRGAGKANGGPDKLMKQARGLNALQGRNKGPGAAKGQRGKEWRAGPAKSTLMEAGRGIGSSGAAGAAGPVEKDGLGFAIGSRAHMGSGSGGVQRSPLRRVAMWGFHSVIGLLLGGVQIQDTQCGFKLFTRAAARQLFSVLHIERWAFDVELVYLSSRLSIPMVEVPVAWHEVAGSKVDLASASIQMLRDIIVIRGCYALGLWKDTAVGLPVSSGAPGVGSRSGNDAAAAAQQAGQEDIATGSVRQGQADTPQAPAVALSRARRRGPESIDERPGGGQDGGPQADQQLTDRAAPERTVEGPGQAETTERTGGQEAAGQDSPGDAPASDTQSEGGQAGQDGSSTGVQAQADTARGNTVGQEAGQGDNGNAQAGPEGQVGAEAGTDAGSGSGHAEAASDGGQPEPRQAPPADDGAIVVEAETEGQAEGEGGQGGQ